MLFPHKSITLFSKFLGCFAEPNPFLFFKFLLQLVSLCSLSKITMQTLQNIENQSIFTFMERIFVAHIDNLSIAHTSLSVIVTLQYTLTVALDLLIICGHLTEQLIHSFTGSQRFECEHGAWRQQQRLNKRCLTNVLNFKKLSENTWQPFLSTPYASNTHSSGDKSTQTQISVCFCSHYEPDNNLHTHNYLITDYQTVS